MLNMVKKGMFGEVVHCDGAYLHDVRDEIVTGKEKRQYRLDNYLNRNCDNYPTHALGPIAKILNINHGNRMVSLCSMSSKAVGVKAYMKEHDVENKELLEKEFVQGDVVTTMIKCAHGETITLTLDTTLPHFYSRNFNIGALLLGRLCSLPKTPNNMKLLEEYANGYNMQMTNIQANNPTIKQTDNNTKETAKNDTRPQKTDKKNNKKNAKLTFVFILVPVIGIAGVAAYVFIKRKTK